MMTTHCDNHHVGVLVRNERGQFAVIETRDEETDTGADIAPVCGHLDGLTYEQAARRLVVDELGLTLRSLAPVLNVWRPDPCLREPGTEDDAGHYWQLFRADVDGPLTSATELGRRARWHSATGLEHLARTTIAYAKGLLAPGEYADSRRLAPVWVGLLADAHVTDVDQDDRATVEPLVSVLAVRFPVGVPDTGEVMQAGSSPAAWKDRLWRVCGLDAKVSTVLPWPWNGVGYKVHVALPDGITRQQLADDAEGLAYDLASQQGGSWSVTVDDGIGPNHAMLRVTAVDPDAAPDADDAAPSDQSLSLPWFDDLVNTARINQQAQQREQVRQELADVRAELARVDVKAGLLLAFGIGVATAAGALLVARPGLPWWSQGAAAGTLIGLFIAAVFLLLAVRPKLRGGVGFVAHAELTVDGSNALALREAIALDTKAREIQVLSRLALNKHRAVQKAVDFIVIALVTLLVALIGLGA